MRITSISVANWKSFGPEQTVPLGPLTLLIGPNATGKSSFLSAVAGLRVAFVESSSAFYNFVTAEHGASLAGGPIEIALAANDESRQTAFRVSGEQATFQRTLFDGASRIFDTVGNGTACAISGNHRVAVAIDARLRDFAIWRPVPSQIGQPHQLQGTRRIDATGANAASLLDGFDPESTEWKAFQDHVRATAPEISRVIAVPTDRGHKEVVFVQRDGTRIPASMASEGLRLLLFVLLLLHGPDRPKFLALEEIEHGIHPSRIRDVVDALRALTRTEGDPQIIITSHSPLVLDMFRDVPENVIVFERPDGGPTVCTPLPQRLALLGDSADGTALGDLWYSGVLGGVPSR